MARIEVRHLNKKYNKQEILKDVSFTISSGDVLGIIGENGAGKSTLMSILVTLIKPSSGDVLYDDNSVISNPSYIRGNIGYVPQDISLYEDLSGIDNLKFWAKTYHLYGDDMKNRLTVIKDIIGLDDEILKKKVKTYSGGMKRRVNIGVALLNDPDIIVMDEPTVGIDIASKDYILAVIKKLKNKGKTIIYTSHYLDEIEGICNKICIMNKGNIIDFKNIEDITNNANNKTLRQYYLDVNRNC
jgi:ABC-2 type transport system ATP-binding protein